MSQKTIEFLNENADRIAELGPSNEKLGRLDDRAARLIRDSGIIRMQQPEKYGGSESHPVEFAEAVMRLAALDGSSGWVAGVVGVHPWELAMADPRVQEEVWGENQETWMASPYAPMGVLRPVDGGYLFSGHWQFSSGTDHCDWLFLGAVIGDADGKPLPEVEQMHVLIPRADYRIVEDSWDVVGLRGTGSKDILVEDAFVPDYRVLTYDRVACGEAAAEAGLTNPLYRMPFTQAFPLGITASVIGMAEGALAHHLAYQRNRVQVTGTQIRDDPYVLYAVGEASAEIAASRSALLDNIKWFYDRAAAGEWPSFAERARGRRTQIQAARRAVRALDEIVDRSGGNGMRMNHPIQRFWRDAHMGMVHAVHVPGAAFHSSALGGLDIEPPPGPLRVMI
ncbi:acyl-CoA dehydrogenase family protein [Sciscionella marina]|uniref:acyl-CoA dehydrogenase family protein n=1 Tax=Sciscionella marina TaxID=508770 RepID=UPI00036CC6BF|nr:acyl-CoA dehydrogenase family protein [Sciscionella marina]